MKINSYILEIILDELYKRKIINDELFEIYKEHLPEEVCSVIYPKDELRYLEKDEYLKQISMRSLYDKYIRYCTYLNIYDLDLQLLISHYEMKFEGSEKRKKFKIKRKINDLREELTQNQRFINYFNLLIN